MIRNWTLGALLLTGALLASPASATIINLTVSPGIGLDITRACTASSCIGTPGTQVWTNNTNYATTGTITIDDVALTMSGVLSVAFSEVTGTGTISEIEFYNTTYTFTNVPITIVGGNQYVPTAGQYAGTVVDPTTVTQVGTGGGSVDPIFNAVRILGGGCLLVSGTGQCGLIFGRTNFQVGAPASRYIEHTFNLAVVPEPTTLVLLGAGVFGLGWVGRRRA